MKRLSVLAVVLMGLLAGPAFATVNESYDPISFDGDDTTLDFAFGWSITQTSDVVVTVVDADGVPTTHVLNSTYSVAPASGANTYSEGPGGVVTFTTAPATGTTVVLSRSTPTTQTRADSSFSRPVQIGGALDKLSRSIQELKDELVMSLRTRVPGYDQDMNLPDGWYDDTGYLYWGGGGMWEFATPIASALNIITGWQDILTGVVSTVFGRTLIDDANNAEFSVTRQAGVYNVRHYGATGDGLTNDTTAVQAAATVAAGGTLIFPEGTYLVSTAITVPADTRIVGLGRATIKLGGAVWALRPQGGNFECYNLDFDGNATGGGIFGQAAHDLFKVVDCNFIDCDLGDAIAGSSDAHGRIEIIRCRISGGKDGIYFPCKYNSALVEGCVVNTLTETGAVHGVHLGYATPGDYDEMLYAKVANCVFTGITTTGVGSECHAVIVYGSYGDIISNSVNNVHNDGATSGGEALYYHGYYGRIINNTIIDGGDSTNGAIAAKGCLWSLIQGNYVTESTTVSQRGIYVDGDNVHILDNTLVGLSGYGIGLGVTGSAAALNNVTVARNTILDHKGSIALYAVAQGGSHFRITDNVIDGLLATEGAISHTYGIYFIASSADYNDVEISRNTIRDVEQTSATVTARGIEVDATTAAARIRGLTITDNIIDINETAIAEYGIILTETSTADPSIAGLRVVNNWVNTDALYDFYCSAADAAKFSVEAFSQNTFAPIADIWATQTIEAPTYAKTVDLTNANIKALAGTPIELVAAPGADNWLEFVGASLWLDYGSNVLTEPSSPDDLCIEYDNGTGPAASATIVASGFITAGADTGAFAIPVSVAGTAAASIVNKNLVLINTGGDYGGNAGNDTVMRVIVRYRVHTGLGL